MSVISVVTPAFNEQANLPHVYDRLSAALHRFDWEWIVVDDHSSDGTFTVVRRLAEHDARVRGVRLAANCGSHAAIACGLSLARGAAAALVVADLQDPPELLGDMIGRWRRGTPIVWAMRRRDAGARESAFPRLYYWVLRRLVGLREMPPGGVDFFVIDRAVIDAFLSQVGRRISVFVLLMRLGFRQEFVEYDKQRRAGGRGGWTLSRKLALVFDSVVCGVTRPSPREPGPRSQPAFYRVAETTESRSAFGPARPPLLLRNRPS